MYFTYHSALEAAHVLLAVPFALTGGIYLLWLLGYNFSVAVWVGFIALFGTAVQTGVVMVIYLEEAVERKRQALGGTLTRAALREAVIEGALLRLRPKVMTVSTVIAGLLPIMWSTRVGAEVMKPLATPVLGGMVSSLLHVLIVTPVIFFWLRERRLGLQHERVAGSAIEPAPRRRVRGCIAASPRCSMLAGVAGWRLTRRPAARRRCADPSRVVQTVRSDDLDIVLLSPTGVLRQGRNTFAIEFRRPAIRDTVDVGSVRASANMPMPGMVMSGGLQVRPTGVPGRYSATAEFGMAGAWRFSLAVGGRRRAAARRTSKGACNERVAGIHDVVCCGRCMLARVGFAPAVGAGASVVPDTRFVDTVERAVAGPGHCAVRWNTSRRCAPRGAGIDVAEGTAATGRRCVRIRPSRSSAGRNPAAPTTRRWSLWSGRWICFGASGRIAVAEHEIAATEHSVADRERMLAAEVRSTVMVRCSPLSASWPCWTIS